MGTLLALMRLMPYDIVPLTTDNYTIARDVYFSNQPYFQLFGNMADDSSIFATINKLPDGISQDNKLIAAICDEDEPVAIIDLIIDYPNKGELWLGLLLVRGDVQSHSKGKSIMFYTMQAAQEAGFNKISLGVHNKNPRAFRFWQKMGFYYERVSGDFLILGADTLQ